jgi:dUTPase
MKKVKIKLIAGGKVPVKGEKNAMCHDCYCREIEHLEGGKTICYLGFAATPPPGWGIRLVPRSNITKHWIFMNNSIGVGDEDFKGEYRVVFTKIPSTIQRDFPYKINERVCQLEIYERENFEFEVVDELAGNDRGGGFGSTGL